MFDSAVVLSIFKINQFYQAVCTEFINVFNYL